MMPKQYSNLNEITELLSSGAFEGYAWYSDEKRGRMMNPFSGWPADAKGFLLEGLFYSERSNTSVHIQYNEGHQITEYSLDGVPAEQLVKVDYLPHRLDGVEKVGFRQYWHPVPDPLCEGMEVLQMKALIFTGFELKTQSS